MKKIALLMTLISCLSFVAHAEETIEVSPADKEVISQQLEKEAGLKKYSTETKQFLLKVAGAFKKSDSHSEVDVKSTGEDCVNCERKTKVKSFFSNLGRKLGKGSAWLTTATGRPFMKTAGFMTGFFEKDKSQEGAALYKFFLNHQEEYDSLYLQAGTTEEMVELILGKTEEILQKKSIVLLNEFAAFLKLDRDIPEDLTQLNLTVNEIASLNITQKDVDRINNHPEYQELKPFFGDLSADDLINIATSGNFDRNISLENFKGAVPKLYEAAGTIAGQVFAPQIALGVVSSTLAGLYAAPVIAAQVGTGVSASICLKDETKANFGSDKDLKMFCSYVINRTGYEMIKGRAKGYVSGKTLRQKLSQKWSDRKKTQPSSLH